MRFLNWTLGDWSLFAIWCLGFGTYPRTLTLRMQANLVRVGDNSHFNNAEGVTK